MKRLAITAASICVLILCLTGCDASNGKVKNSPALTASPTMTIKPSASPTPSLTPTASPTLSPTAEPTETPTETPTDNAPSASPSAKQKTGVM